VPGKVELCPPPDDGASGPVDLDVNGRAQVTEPGIGFGYDIYLTYVGNASYGAES
jgi:hypothetical protein